MIAAWPKNLGYFQWLIVAAQRFCILDETLADVDEHHATQICQPENMREIDPRVMSEVDVNKPF